jgi:hypothetical protein
MNPVCFERRRRASPAARACITNETTPSCKSRHVLRTHSRMAHRNVPRAIYRVVADLIVVMLKAFQEIGSHALLSAGVHACAG